MVFLSPTDKQEMFVEAVRQSYKIGLKPKISCVFLSPWDSPIDYVYGTQPTLLVILGKMHLILSSLSMLFISDRPLQHPVPLSAQFLHSQFSSLELSLRVCCTWCRIVSLLPCLGFSIMVLLRKENNAQFEAGGRGGGKGRQTETVSEKTERD